MSQSAVTILGMVIIVSGMILAFIAAFLTAFLAEPVKTYVQNRQNIANLRLALYKELIYNYTYLDGLRNSFDEAKKATMLMYLSGNFTFTTHCYEQAISSKVEMFYQLREASLFKSVYSLLSLAVKLPTMKEVGVWEALSQESYAPAMRDAVMTFMRTVEMHAYEGTLDNEILKKNMPEQKYSELLERGSIAVQEVAKQTAVHTG
jgi:hypothetical protein